MSRKRGARCPEALKHRCPECGAEPMEWCWVFQEVDRQNIERFPDLYRHAYPHPNGRPNMFVIERRATQLHASRRNLKGGRWADVKRRSSRYKRSTGINLVLTDYGGRKIDVIKVIRNLFNYTLRHSKELTDNVPSVVKEDLTDMQAKVAMRKLREAGASVEIKETSEYE